MSEKKIIPQAASSKLVRGIYRLPLLDSAHRSSAPNVHDYQIRILLCPFQILRHRSENKRIADPMEPILAQLVSRRHFLINRVRAHLHGQAVVEGRVKVCKVFHFGQLLSARANDLERGEVVSTLVSVLVK